jgi:pyrimidine deaminase RibD-like protein
MHLIMSDAIETTRIHDRQLPSNKSRSKYDSVEEYKKSNVRQKQYLDVCGSLAVKSPLTHKHGCIIVKGNKIISKGYNNKTNVYSESSIHAEIAALRKVKHLLDETCTMYVVRIGTPEQYAFKYSKPCATCASMITKFKIRTVFYSVNSY